MNCRLRRSARQKSVSGPIALVSSTYPILALAPTDESDAGFSALTKDLRVKGACTLVAETRKGATPSPASALGRDHPRHGCDLSLFKAFMRFWCILRHAAAPTLIDRDTRESHAHPMSANQHAIAPASRVFDGESLRTTAAVIVEGDRVAAIVQRHDVPAAIPVRESTEHVWLTPGFIDIQVNGGGDVLFNDAPTAGTIRKMIAAHRRLRHHGPVTYPDQ